MISQRWSFDWNYLYNIMHRVILRNLRDLHSGKVDIISVDTHNTAQIIMHFHGVELRNKTAEF